MKTNQLPLPPGFDDWTDAKKDGVRRYQEFLIGQSAIGEMLRRIDTLVSERDLAREAYGHEKAMHASKTAEMYRWLNESLSLREQVKANTEQRYIWYDPAGHTKCVHGETVEDFRECLDATIAARESHNIQTGEPS